MAFSQVNWISRLTQFYKVFSGIPSIQFLRFHGHKTTAILWQCNKLQISFNITRQNIQASPSPFLPFPPIPFKGLFHLKFLCSHTLYIHFFGFSKGPRIKRKLARLNKIVFKGHRQSLRAICGPRLLCL